MANRSNKKSSSYRLSVETMAEIAVLAEKLRCSRAQVIETAVALYFAWAKEKENQEE